MQDPDNKLQASLGSSKTFPKTFQTNPQEGPKTLRNSTQDLQMAFTTATDIDIAIRQQNDKATLMQTLKETTETFD